MRRRKRRKKLHLSRAQSDWVIYLLKSHSIMVTYIESNAIKHLNREERFYPNIFITAFIPLAKWLAIFVTSPILLSYLGVFTYFKNSWVSLPTIGPQRGNAEDEFIGFTPLSNTLYKYSRFQPHLCICDKTNLTSISYTINKIESIYFIVDSCFLLYNSWTRKSITSCDSAICFSIPAMPSPIL